MQEKKKPVFVVATANNISQLPPELLRKGRVDEIFFVDLPGKEARKEILSIHLRKKKRDPDEFDLDLLAKESVGYSGAELEEAVKSALFQAFDQDDRTLTDEHLLAAIKKTYPISKTMGEVVQKMREWGRTRAVLAATEEGEKITGKATGPVLKQESINPFI
jgi:SpoVK/Ycf46/Vps4 family AAA+-type ATPase